MRPLKVILLCRVSLLYSLCTVLTFPCCTAIHPHNGSDSLENQILKQLGTQQPIIELLTTEMPQLVLEEGQTDIRVPACMTA